LGYHQRRYPFRWKSLVWQGQPIDLVRRPSGGRAVLHQGDLTYAVITSGISGNRMQAYQKICEFLIQGWQAIGVSLYYGEAGRGYIHNPNCFGTATGADLVMDSGTKLIGSAQLRRGDAILQHGSMQLHPDPTLFEQVFNVPFSAHLPLNCSVEAIVSALLTSAQACFQMQLVTQPITPEELAGVAPSYEFYKVPVNLPGNLEDNQ
jgi:lipoate-protein ligase A